jgi:amino acid adenylation domain-containing protein
MKLASDLGLNHLNSRLMPESVTCQPGVLPATVAESPFRRIHHFIEAAAARTPAAVALIHGAESVTYRELDARANRLARHLQELGVGPEVIVAICLERSVGAILSILAVLKAGGAYLPLDPAYPADRLAYMLDNARASLLLTEPEIWQGRAAPGRTLSFREFEFARKSEPLDGTPPAALPAPPDDDPLAYVIYTSGSTGRPKGVAVANVSTCHLIRWHAANMPVPPGARVLQNAPLSFDVSVQELFATLADGGTLVLIDEALRRDPPALRAFLAAQRIARLFLTPVLLYRLAELPGPPLPDLRDVIAAGEQLRITPAVVRLFSQDTGATLHNQYGPTETTVITHSHRLTGAPESWPLLPPLGHTIEGVKPLLLGPDRQPVPAGQPGELYFGGRTVSRGYLHDPERTGAAFLPDPENPGARIYRSGDLSQQNPDGTWQFLGRADDQVKVRGFRIELGEIEAVLARHPAIEQAAVAASEPTASGDRELVAGYLLRPSLIAPTSIEVRGWLRGQLPDYFVPARLVALDRLPVTPSGKLDRRALVAACQEAWARETELPPAARPSTPTEQTVAQAWRQVLGRGSVGVDDNFFDAGGNSISALRVHGLICEALDIEFPVTVFFQRPTIRALATHLDHGSKAAATKGDSAQERARRQQQAFVRPPPRPVARPLG